MMSWDDVKFYSEMYARRIRYMYPIKNHLESRRNKKILEENRLKYKNTENPLVSVLIATYNRPELLTERAVPSVLRQTYQNFELIIIGDHCTNDTEERLKKFKDERIKFFNLPERGKYPEDPHKRWLVAGTAPANKAIELSSGEWLAPLDDDDEFSDDHIETLLKFATDNDYDMVYGKVRMETEPDKWDELGSYPLEGSCISHMAVLYSSRLKFMKYDINCWKYIEPVDLKMWRQMKEAGARIGFINRIVGNHYLEKNQEKE
ncbi:glycosyltransferase family 2 protein [Methanobacterium congolense]|uniref:Glycosyl transferase family 2 n=1 Tax=Methanobacterium congolense TaxID=118062 RepID=A0A1D3L4K0_9EURY|nr:glycosyltransferase [Methanobacterium congolense]SCG86400.1 Glycosyl transferase family 2 [Methanobacterium congolense]